MDYVIINGELRHHGVLGMRWGRRRYQNKDGSLTAAGKKRYQKEEEKLKAEKQRLKNEAATEKKISKLESLRKEVDDMKKQTDHKKSDVDAEKAEYEEAKQKALKSGDAKEILKYKADLTKQEMDAAKARLQWEKDMEGFIPKGESAADKAFEKIGKYTNYATTSIKAWNAVANVVNAFSDNPIPMPKIDVDLKTSNRDQRLKAKKVKSEQDKAEARRRETEAAKQKAEKQAEKEAKKQAKKEARDEAKRQDAENEAKRYKEEAKRYKEENKKQRNNHTDDKVYEGTVEGEGTSKRRETSYEKSSNRNRTFYDASYEDISNSSYTGSGRSYVYSNDNLLDTSTASLPPSRTDSGRDYIAGLLGP